jgi:hypothetical protein
MAGRANRAQTYRIQNWPSSVRNLWLATTSANFEFCTSEPWAEPWAVVLRPFGAEDTADRSAQCHLQLGQVHAAKRRRPISTKWNFPLRLFGMRCHGLTSESPQRMKGSTNGRIREWLPIRHSLTPSFVGIRSLETEKCQSERLIGGFPFGARRTQSNRDGSRTSRDRPSRSLRATA